MGRGSNPSGIGPAGCSGPAGIDLAARDRPAYRQSRSSCLLLESSTTKRVSLVIQETVHPSDEGDASWDAKEQATESGDELVTEEADRRAAPGVDSQHNREHHAAQDGLDDQQSSLARDPRLHRYEATEAGGMHVRL